MTVTLFGEADARPVRRPKAVPAVGGSHAGLFDAAATTADEWQAVELAFEQALDHLPAVARKLRLGEAAVTACWGELLALLSPDHYAVPTGSMAATPAGAGNCPLPPVCPCCGSHARPEADS